MSKFFKRKAKSFIRATAGKFISSAATSSSKCISSFLSSSGSLSYLSYSSISVSSMLKCIISPTSLSESSIESDFFLLSMSSFYSEVSASKFVLRLSAKRPLVKILDLPEVVSSSQMLYKIRIRSLVVQIFLISPEIVELKILDQHSLVFSSRSRRSIAAPMKVTL